MTYLALVLAGDWALSGDDLLQVLQADWPGVAIEACQGDPTCDVVWSHGEGAGCVEGSSHVSGQCIYLDGQGHPVAEFVAWYRRVVPAEQTVILCDDAYSFDVIVDPGSTAADIQDLLPE
ncbi:hypothetical protein ACFYON_09710 [Micromonospora sp. NPDC005686]|uniref:hypothetical protein n=1 Tax=unclassified Micromonospora TaxID=2617518 RepID=UPI0033A21E4A